MKITFEGKTFSDIFDQMQDLLRENINRSMSANATTTALPSAAEAQGPGPEVKAKAPKAASTPELPVEIPAEKPVDPRIAKMQAAKAAKKAREAVAAVETKLNAPPAPSAPEPEPTDLRSLRLTPPRSSRCGRRPSRTSKRPMPTATRRRSSCCCRCSATARRASVSFRPRPSCRSVRPSTTGPLKGRPTNGRACRLLAFIGRDVAGVPRQRHPDEGRYPSFVEVRPRGYGGASGRRDDPEGDIFLPDKIMVEGDEYIVSPRHVPGPEPLHLPRPEPQGPAGSHGVPRTSASSFPDTGGKVWGTLDCGVARQQRTSMSSISSSAGALPSIPRVRS